MDKCIAMMDDLLEATRSAICIEGLDDEIDLVRLFHVVGLRFVACFAMCVP